jgi:hypothetical protein
MSRENATVPRTTWARRVALTQAALYFATGVWPLVHLPSFLVVTGPKTDLWLVQTFGALLAVVGLALGLVAWRGRISREWCWLGAGGALVLGTSDVVFVARGVIAPIYLADAALEAAIVAGWIAAAPRSTR